MFCFHYIFVMIFRIFKSLKRYKIIIIYYAPRLDFASLILFLLFLSAFMPIFLIYFYRIILHIYQVLLDIIVLWYYVFILIFFVIFLSRLRIMYISTSNKKALSDKIKNIKNQNSYKRF